MSCAQAACMVETRGAGLVHGNLRKPARTPDRYADPSVESGSASPPYRQAAKFMRASTANGRQRED
jgi:hypothetical protein